MTCRICISPPMFMLLFAFLMPSVTCAADVLLQNALTAKEIRQQFLDQTVETAAANGKKKALLYFGPDGQLKHVRKNRLYHGSWSVRKNGRLCMSLEDGQKKCRAVVNSANELLQVTVKKDGDHRHELTYKEFHPGNQLKKLNRSPLLPAGTLTTGQLKRLLSDHTVESVTIKKRRVSLSYYDPDGTIRQKRNGVYRTGTWKAKNSRICIQMENLKNKCRIIVKEGDTYTKYIVKKNGHHQRSVAYTRFIPGNQL